MSTADGGRLMYFSRISIFFEKYRNQFLLIISQDLQKAPTANFACVQHVLGGRCMSNFFRIFQEKKHAN